MQKNSEEQQKAPLTFRLNAPRVPLTNIGEQPFKSPPRGLVGGGGPQGLRPLPLDDPRRLLVYIFYILYTVK